ncbi:retrovirus-related pol polyprotein from transposon TNT 1-94 [Tanacetum coccineum]
MYSVDMKNIVPKECLTCLVAKATLDESMLWHRRLGHVNFKTINKLVKENLVRGLPSKRFENDQTCVACLKGKQHKASCKSKIQNSITQPLFMLHMDLFGPTFVSSLMNKKYCLVVTDDYSRFTWVFFLATKDETSGILKSFITEIENLVDKKVKIIRCDNGTEFKNRVMSEFCEKKGIKREFSTARTPQQNGVAKKRNRILIEAARTMLADSKLPTIFWAKVVNIACYVQNRVLVVKPHNKTPYELFRGNGSKWLFDNDVLTKSLNYVPVIAGTNSNDLVDGSLFDSSLKNASNDEPQPSSDVKKKDNKGVCKESGIVDQEKLENSTQGVNTDGSSINTEPDMFSLEDNATTTHADFFSDEIELDMSNITTTCLVPSTPNIRIYKDHSLDHVISDIQSSVMTRRMTKTTNEQGFISVAYEGQTYDTCLFACFLSQEEPKKVWTLVDLLLGKRAIGTKWVYRNKKDERGIVIRNKVRLVAQCYTQEEGIDYDEVFASVARIEAIRLFLAYASFKDFIVYQMDVKSAFLYGKIEKEVYVCQPPGFEDPEFPDRVYKHKSSNMSSMVELTFFLGLEVTQKDDGIFISQDQYVDEILKKFGFQREEKMLKILMFTPQKKQPRRKQRKDTEVPQPSGSTEPITDEAANKEHVPTHSNDPLFSGEDRLQLKKLLELCTKLSKRVLDLENTKTSQAAKITKLKERVKKLERRNKLRNPGLKRLRKGRKIADLDADVEITLVDEAQGRNDDNLMFDIGVLDEQEVKVEKVVSTAKVTTVSATTTTVDELTLAQTLIEIKAAKPKAFTTTATTTTIAITRPKARGVIVQEPTQLNAELEEEEKLAEQREEDANIAE